MRRRRMTALLALGALCATLTGCGTGVRRTAQAELDRIVPGQATVLDVDYHVELGTYGVSASLHDDPDAVVRFRLSGSEDCGAGSACEEKVRTAVASARSEAAELRLLTAAFEGCGHPIIGFRSLVVNSEPRQVYVDEAVVAGTVDDSTLAPLATELDRCVAAWVGAERTGPTGQITIDLNVVDPAVVATAPAPDPRLPAIARLDDDDLMAALTGPARYKAEITWRSGHPVAPVATLLRPEMPFDEQQRFDAPVLDAVRHWSARSGVAARPTIVLHDATRFATDTTHRLDVVVPLDDGGPGEPGTAVMMTVDRDGGAARDIVRIPLEVDQNGALVPPTRPHDGWTGMADG